MEGERLRRVQPHVTARPSTVEASPNPSFNSLRREQATMTDRQVRQPGPDHPITIEPKPARVLVRVAGRVVADTRNALTLREAGHQPVQYIPSALTR
jgi:hypothetical protein